MQVENIHEMYDHHTRLIMKMILKSDSNCVDVGAHVGEVLRDIVRLSPNGRHYAFEPIPDLFSKLMADPDFSGVRVSDCALSEEPGEAPFFHVENAPAYSGLKQRRYDRPDPMIREIKVKTARLDDVLPAEQRIDLIKIDVEGAEMLVLRGATRIVREYKPYVIFESGLGASDRYGTNGATLHDFFDSCGLEVSTLDGFLTGADVLTKAELVDVFNNVTRYYFVAHRPLSEKERQQHFREYMLALDSLLFSAAKLRERICALEHQLIALLPLVRVEDWGPRQTSVGQGVNTQPDGSSALWIQASNVSQIGDVYVEFSGLRAAGRATVADHLVTTGIAPEVIQKAGKYEVVIVEASGRRTGIGTFAVTP